MESRLEQMDLMLATGMNDVHMIGICGMGGIGKTTLARVVFDKISYQFDGSSFLANVREVSMTQGLVTLQQQLISEILMDNNIKIRDVQRGWAVIRSRLRYKRVLVVLDDVDDLDQLQALSGKNDWFGLGSRIIVTTRDRHLLVSHGVDNIYKVGALNHGEALQLFCRKAFRQSHPTDGYSELSYCMVNYADGLPLALEVLGSLLFGRTRAEWKDALNRLKKVPDCKIFEILKISYDGLQETEKKIFLDIACFFKGKDKDRVRELLASCDLYPDIGMSILVDKCIITLSNNNICMHDLIQGMGREIVRRECPEKPGGRSRLWLWTDIYRVLTENGGTETVEGIIIDLPSYKGVKLNATSFSRMNSLRLLKIRDVCPLHGIEYLSNELRLLNWHGYPLKSLPSNFQPEKLYKLNMCYSRVEQLWQGVQNMYQLKIIKLSHSEHLTGTPDFTGVPNLERLVLDGCINLSFVHQSIGLLERLKILNLKDCGRLRSFPTVIKWGSLEVLILSGCSKLRNVREIVVGSNNLLQLFLDGTSIEEIPPSIKHLIRLTKLSLRDCKNLISLSSNICDLRCLKVLDLNGCSKFENVPENLGHVASLEKLDLGGTAIRKPPSSIILLKNLKELSFNGCKGQVHKSWSSIFWLPFLPRSNPDSIGFFLPSLSGLCSLTRLDLGDCNLQEGAIPDDLGCLSSLTHLNLSRNNFLSIPASISELSKLETLNLDYCKMLQALPDLPASIDGLFAHNCTSLLTLSLPSNISDSTPRMFYLSNCFKLAGNQGNKSVSITFFKSLLQSLLRSQLQGLKTGITFPEFDIVVPGSRVPEWFIYQSRCSSITILPPTQATTNLCRGLALCAAFSIHWHGSFFKRIPSLSNPLILRCQLKIDKCPKYSHFSISFHPDYLTQSDHLWLCYISQSYFNCSLGNNLKQIQAIFLSESHPYTALHVKECGIRPVYNHDVEEFIQASNEFSSGDSAKTVIKRSRDYYLPYQQPHPKRIR